MVEAAGVEPLAEFINVLILLHSFSLFVILFAKYVFIF